MLCGPMETGSAVHSMTLKLGARTNSADPACTAGCIERQRELDPEPIGGGKYPWDYPSYPVRKQP